MLYALGPLVFEVAPVNVHEVDRETEASWVEKPVVGRRPPLEFTGDGPEKFSLRGRMFPRNFGGLEGLAALNAMRSAGVPFPLIRGDGTPLGWFAVTNAKEQNKFLGQDGVGNMIEYEIQLSRDDAPSPLNFVTALFAL